MREVCPDCPSRVVREAGSLLLALFMNPNDQDDASRINSLTNGGEVIDALKQDLSCRELAELLPKLGVQQCVMMELLEATFTDKDMQNFSSLDRAI